MSPHLHLKYIRFLFEQVFVFLSTYQPFTVAEILLNTLESKKKSWLSREKKQGENNKRNKESR